MTTVYDIAESPSIDGFVYDVKILYQLHGHRFENFSDLCAQTLDETTMGPYKQAVNVLHGHFQSYIECGIDMSRYAVSELVPANTLSAFKDEKAHLTERLLSRFHDEPVLAFYEQFFERVRCLHEVGKHLGLKFNFVGSKTGRLSFKRSTFNPYTLPKQKRDCIVARPSHHLCQFDLKASQPRMAIFSTDDYAFRDRVKEIQDIYSLFEGDREHNKIGLLRWMFSDQSIDTQYARVCAPITKLKRRICEDAYRDGCLCNRFHRPLRFTDEAPNVIFQRYVSSTEADALYELVQVVHERLKGTRSRVLLPFFDAILCEFHDDERHLAGTIQELIENHFADHVFFARLPVEVKVGPDYAHMESQHGIHDKLQRTTENH